AGGVGRGDAFVAGPERLRFAGPRICAVNKIDLLRRPAIAAQLERAAALGEFDHIVPVSARSGDGLEELREVLAASLPEGKPAYAAGETTDLPLETRIAEIVREKALALTREEVPHSIAVQLESAAALGEFDHIVPVSARSGDGLEELREVLAASLPEGKPAYAAGETTDLPLETRIAEIVREKALALTREEVPHSIAVQLE